MTSDVNKTVQPGSESVQRTKVGLVESDKRDKTRTVVVRWAVKHPKYGKFMRRKTVLQVHDAGNESRSGDLVEVEPCRPISKTKTWRLVRVVEKNKKVAALQVSATER